MVAGLSVKIISTNDSFVVLLEMRSVVSGDNEQYVVLLASKNLEHKDGDFFLSRVSIEIGTINYSLLKIMGVDRGLFVAMALSTPRRALVFYNHSNSEVENEA